MKTTQPLGTRIPAQPAQRRRLNMRVYIPRSFDVNYLLELLENSAVRSGFKTISQLREGFRKISEDDALWTLLNRAQALTNERTRLAKQIATLLRHPNHVERQK